MDQFIVDAVAMMAKKGANAAAKVMRANSPSWEKQKGGYHG